MAIIRWRDPFGLLPRWFWRWPTLWEEEEWPEIPTVTRGLDVYETNGEVVVKAAVPGIDPKKIDISFKDGRLWIRAEVEEEEKGRKYYQKSQRAYNYALDVPGIDPAVEPKKAEFENGTVEVTFAKAKKEEEKAKRIPVKVKTK